MLAEGTFEGKVAIVTGGGSGMGRAMALEFARLGAVVVVGGRRPEPLEETIAQIEDDGGAGHAKPTDVRDPDQVDALVADAVKRFGRVDVLVNNAAGNFVVKAEDLSPGGWRAVVGIVLDGGFLCARAAGRQMIEQGEGGAILSVLASYAWTGGPGTVHSASAKAGLLAMTRTLAVEWAGHGIRVNGISPGTDRHRRRGRRALAHRGGSRARRRHGPARPPRNRRGDRLVVDCALLALRRRCHRRSADASTAVSGSSRRATCRLSASNLVRSRTDVSSGVPQSPTMSSGLTGTRVSSRPVASRNAAATAAVDTTVGGSPTPFTP